MPDKSAKAPAEPDEDQQIEKRVDEMMDPALPDAPKEAKGTSGDKTADGLPPLDIFKDPSGAPDVPTKLLGGKDAENLPADSPKLTAEVAAPIEPGSDQPGENPAEPDDVDAEEPNPKAEPADINDPATEAALDDIAAKDSDAVLAAEDAKRAGKPDVPHNSHRLKKFLKSKKTIPLWVVIILIILAAVPFTRYRIAGLFMKRQASVVVLDSKTNTPVSGASVQLAGQQATTDASGAASLKVPVGKDKLQIAKNYYQAYKANVLVPLGHAKSFKVALVATGRQVPIKLVNKITGSPLAGVNISVSGTTAKTDQHGQATIVLPTKASSQNATFTLNGYNSLQAGIEVTGQVVAANTFQMTPSGKVFFLSNLSGTLDVMSANLDGSDRQTILKGTGNEDPSTTALVASPDWNYVALAAQRSSAGPELYIINTSTGKLTTADTTPASYTLIGWQGDRLVYDVERTDTQRWQAGHELLKSYTAASGNATTLDSASASGDSTAYSYQAFGNINLVGSDVVYTTQWYSAGSASAPSLSGQNDTIRSISVDGTNKQDGKTFPATSVGYMAASIPAPGAVELFVSNFGQNSGVYFNFKNGVLQPDLAMTSSSFNQARPTYLLSPSGHKTFWSEQRDGKNTLLVGDQYGNNPQTIASLSDYQPYGWYGDDYLLVSQGDNQLFIMAPGGQTAPLKIADYYRPSLSLLGSGYGYGGNAL